MNNGIKCPVCSNDEGGSFQRLGDDFFKCDTCGTYKMRDKLHLYLIDHKYDSRDWDLSPPQRAGLSHSIRKKSDEYLKTGSDPFEITSDVLDSFRSNRSLPSRAEQATNIIQFIGDEVSRSGGEAVDQLPVGFYAIIGARDRDAAIRLTKELVKHQRLTANLSGAAGIDPATGRPFSSVSDIDLSLDEWNQYEAKKRGEFDGNYCFLAMQFNVPALDCFVERVVKPTVNGMGYDLVDMNKKRAGIIDNIMRNRIRDAKFVIADLTHDNNGAYWEAGYAEGLGKPVIYICEKEKFDEKKTHFDTNHCTTVTWSRDDDEAFRKDLTETISESLDES